MKVKIKNLGVLRKAEFELGDMTIICGSNNTGKTYATYAFYGFLSYWKEAYPLEISSVVVDKLLKEGAFLLDLEQFVTNAQKIVDEACTYYCDFFFHVFGSKKINFEKTEFNIDISNDQIIPMEEFNRKLGTSKKQLFSISKKNNSSNVELSLLVSTGTSDISEDLVYSAIGDAIKEIVFSSLFPNPFIASAERTGAAIFRKELFFARNRLLEQMSLSDRDINPFELLDKSRSDYALPVRRNVEYTRQLVSPPNQESFIAVEHPQILYDFSDIIGGEFKVMKEELYFIPNGNKRMRLTMDESSSSVRSLLDLGFYLRYFAEKNDVLIIDEPELNLHPENQRRIARLFARLVNIGFKVFLTTHSDYIVKELNTLIMLNNENYQTAHIMESVGYRSNELLKVEQIQVFVAKKAPVLLDGKSRKSSVPTFVPANIKQATGIEVGSFDKTIDDMNKIQSAIIFGREID